MRILLTGATGFIGSFLVPELLAAGHHVVGLCRSDSGADAVAAAGAEVLRGDVNDGAALRTATAGVDGVIHAAFHHDFASVKRHSEEDRQVIATLGAALAGSGKPLVLTSGTGLVRSRDGSPATETDEHATAAEFPRAASEEAADALIAAGGRVMVVRLPQVHDTRRQGRLTQHVLLARQRGWVAYIGEGTHRVPAVHVSDAVRLYRMAIERGQPGARYHAVAEEGVPLRAIAQAIGERLQLRVESLGPEQAPDYFGPLAPLVAIDLAASAVLTRQQLDWEPIGPSLLTDLRNLDLGGVMP